MPGWLLSRDGYDMLKKTSLSLSLNSTTAIGRITLSRTLVTDLLSNPV